MKAFRVIEYDYATGKATVIDYWFFPEWGWMWARTMCYVAGCWPKLKIMAGLFTKGAL